MTERLKHCAGSKGAKPSRKSRARGALCAARFTIIFWARSNAATSPQAREQLFTSAQEKEIAAAFRQVPDGTLVDISALLGGKYDILLLHIFSALGRQSNAHRQQ
jgi:hypothetical protein